MNAELELFHSGNPSGLEGIEFIEYATSRPQALGHVLELMGFQQVARHRSREVLLYRQGTMNVVVNAHDSARPDGTSADEEARISAVAFRARDAAAAYRRALQHGAWAVPTHVEVMELNIPAIHGVGASRIYFVDRHREFSIYTVDFIPVPGAEQQPPPIAGMGWFGLVQSIGPGRTEVWTEFYDELFAFQPIPDDQRVAMLSGGRVLRSPCGAFYLQLIEAEPGVPELQVEEGLARVGLGTGDVIEATRILRGRGVEFMDTDVVRVTERGALTCGLADGVMFELVRDDRVGASLP